MSNATAVNGDESTLRNPNNPDDSLCTDEFEIISSDTLDNGAQENGNDTVSHWSIQHSINVESLVPSNSINIESLVPLNNLASLLCTTHSDAHSASK
ncbi:unnamed protein product [Strongylus vulgaris]|uniref:Uncharacterized protein n=1 Tax=Strongylus vulgaris TaxID=40348 RepID=A0A3P7JX81_STRVU|nr:unnamed protein product [Strongylus vulgaris]